MSEVRYWVAGVSNGKNTRSACAAMFVRLCEAGRGRHSATRSIESDAVRTTHLDFRYQPIAEPEEVGNGGRVPWVSGRPGDAPAYAGTDFIIARDGRIAAIYLFFDKLP